MESVSEKTSLQPRTTSGPTKASNLPLLEMIQRTLHGSVAERGNVTPEEINHVSRLLGGDPEALAEQKRRIASEAAARNAAARRADRWAHLGLSGNMQNQTFDSYKPEHLTQRQALTMCQQWVEAWPDVREQGFMLWGEPGVGKSHLLRAVGIALIELPNPPIVRHVYAPEIERILIRERGENLRRRETGERALDLESDMVRCDVLLLNDLSKVSSATNAGWVLNVIGCLIERIEAARAPVLCSTSNDPPQQLTSVLGGPLVDRLQGVMHWREVKGRSRAERAEAPYWAGVD